MVFLDTLLGANNMDNYFGVFPFKTMLDEKGDESSCK